MPVIIEFVEQRKDDAIGYRAKDFQPVRVVTYHLPDEALLSDDDERDGDFLSEAVGMDDDGFERVIVAETVRKLVASAGLTDREKAVIQATYWDEDDDATIAQRLKISVVRVRQLRQAALLKLRFQARKWGLL
jgi:DNA-directed RNA polymerase, sigma subunit (sigma70/sigma32)